ncbi:MAG: holo-[acyl-carrier-protein] synthase [Dehalococcoidia bacterium]|nr:holo-[acyl-carrier-protein] synthase [Dehalococcoidia bacterium]MQG15985.1 holo-[acyl-carrier-protein] synthase [SAR202 cluster bacterium]|tara:strand:+ start:81 stop:461 length:381 start_codon:yes stop_codon:yes gene_type:complete
MTLVHGIDIIEIDRIRNVVNQYGSRFYNRIYSTLEIEYCNGNPSKLATRFAAKEAVMKALGTGIRGVSWKEIEVLRQPGQAPQIRLHGRASQRASSLGITEMALSLSHSDNFAIASVVAESKTNNY